MVVAERLSIAEVFDRHASFIIDTDAYQTNPMLHEVADRIFAKAGLMSSDVTRDGVIVYRDHAVISTFEKTADGERIMRDGALVRRTVSVTFDEADT
jgi:hypothetical protein